MNLYDNIEDLYLEDFDRDDNKEELNQRGAAYSWEYESWYTDELVIKFLYVLYKTLCATRLANSTKNSMTKTPLCFNKQDPKRKLIQFSSTLE